MPRTIVVGGLLIALALSGCEVAPPESHRAFEAPTREATVSSSADIREAQRLLSTLGYDAGAADGVLGPRTRSAITDYQSRNGLVQSGQLTAELLQQLRRSAPKLQAARSPVVPKARRSPQPAKAATPTAETRLPSLVAASANPAPCERDETAGKLGRVPQLTDLD